MSFIPPSKYAVSDWHQSNKLLQTNAERLRDSSHTIRQDARRLRNETDSQTLWTQTDSNTKLGKRIDDINEWKESLEKCLDDTDKEIQNLQLVKGDAELSLAAKKLALDIAVECLVLRENRQGIDLVRDKVEEQLQQEVEVIEGIKALLQQKADESFEQLCLLQEARQQLHCDLTDKCHALEIDSHNHKLNNESTKEIGFLVNSAQTVKGSVTLETWDSFSQYNRLRGESEMKSSRKLRESIFATLEKTKIGLESQRKATEFEFRKRIHETHQAVNELEWQEENTTCEIETLKQDITSLKNAIDAKMAPLQVAQTRLENRTRRENVELCRDIPQYQMCYETEQVEATIRTLNEKLCVAETALRSLMGDLARIKNELAVKTNSLHIENQCMDTRKQLTKQRVAVASDEKAIIKPERKVTLQKQPTETAIRPVADDTMVEGLTIKSALKSTYNADYDELRTKRSADLKRTVSYKEPICD